MSCDQAGYPLPRLIQQGSVSSERARLLRPVDSRDPPSEGKQALAVAARQNNAPAAGTNGLHIQVLTGHDSYMTPATELFQFGELMEDCSRSVASLCPRQSETVRARHTF